MLPKAHLCVPLEAPVDIEMAADGLQHAQRVGAVGHAPLHLQAGRQAGGRAGGRAGRRAGRQWHSRLIDVAAAAGHAACAVPASLPLMPDRPCLNRLPAVAAAASWRTCTARSSSCSTTSACCRSGWRCRAMSVAPSSSCSPSWSSSAVCISMRYSSSASWALHKWREGGRWAGGGTRQHAGRLLPRQRRRESVVGGTGSASQHSRCGRQEGLLHICIALCSRADCSQPRVPLPPLAAPAAAPAAAAARPLLAARRCCPTIACHPAAAAGGLARDRSSGPHMAALCRGLGGSQGRTVFLKWKVCGAL